MKCFVIMPFHAAFDTVFQTVKAAAADAVPDQGMDCFWLKDVLAAGRITDDVMNSLDHSAICIADVTDNNPNVMWETGYAMALGKPTILIGQRVETLPFDLKDHRVLPYDLAALDDLRNRLREALRQTLARYEIVAQLSPPAPVPADYPIIAVTGSMHAGKARTQRRIETLLRPYLSPHVTWYCGGNGVVDEMALHYLLAHEQRVLVVGYTPFDLSLSIRQMVREGRVQALDALVEPIPRGMSGPTERDILFAAKADLVVLLWDGKSEGTRELVRYFEESAKSLLIGFV